MKAKTQCLKTAQKVWIFRATLISQKTFGYAFLPLIYSFEFLQILVILHYKKNNQEFKRIFEGQKCITQGFQRYRLESDKS